MPELPEVETVKNGLKKNLKPGVTISKVEFLRADLRNILPVKFKNKIVSQPIIEISRRAKYILIKCEHVVIVSHLGMTGTWRIEKGSKKNKRAHDHILLYLSNGQRLIYNDPRRFGIFDIIDTDKVSTYSAFQKLGPEPLSEKFSSEYLFQKSRKRNVPIKSFLMDQAIVVGVGNIYACEALFKAKLSPFLKAAKLTAAQCSDIVKDVKAILSQAISSGGSSINNYYSVEASPGSFQDEHFVYGRKGQSCRKCRGVIQVAVISGRSTFWCVNCQKGSPPNHERTKVSSTRKNLSTSSRIKRPRGQHRKAKR